MPVAFVSFNLRWAAAVCAQTEQSKNPTLWLTDRALEPCDVYWRNLAIPFVSLSIRKFVMSTSVFALVFFYMIPIAFVQSLANLEGLERVAPWLRPVIEVWWSEMCHVFLVIQYQKMWTSSSRLTIPITIPVTRLSTMRTNLPDL